jgi:circadian clock protein KaiB
MKKHPFFNFRLYVAGEAANSMLAVANLHALCREHLPERHEIEIVDVLREPKRALAEGVLLTPMLVRVSPDPIRKLIGNLSDSKPLLQMLELPM